MEVPFKEAEYLVASDRLSIGCLLDLSHFVELKIRGEKDMLPSEPLPNLALFRTPRALEAQSLQAEGLYTARLYYHLATIQGFAFGNPCQAMPSPVYIVAEQ